MKQMKKRLFLIIIIAIAVFKMQAQQDAHYSLYMFNGLYLNPAYAGSHEGVDLMAIYRHQWSGVQGAPRSGNISVHSPMKRQQYALGLILSGDKLGLTNSFGITGSFAYRIKTTKKTKLAIGIQAGVTNYQQNNSTANIGLQDVGIDDGVFQVDRNRWIPNVGLGVYWYSEKFQIGLSVPHLLPTTFTKNISVSTTKELARIYNHYIFTAGYITGKETTTIRIRPCMLIKYAPGLNKRIPDFDLSLSAFIINRFMIGVNYRLGTAFNAKYGSNSIAILAQAKIIPSLRIGYAFEHTFTKLNLSRVLGSHDIMIGYEFNNKNKRVLSPRFVSFF